jgi:hypothetical protein
LEHVSRLAVYCLLFGMCLVSNVVCQTPDDVAPPPLKMLSKSERTQLADKPQTKEHTSLALQLMDTRLRSAEKLCADENFSLMYAELGGFQALMDNTLSFLLKSDSNEGKQLNSLKKFEIGLRTFAPRIEAIRRDLPSSFEPYVKDLIRFIGDTRERAMQPFFSDTVISNN